MFSLRSSFSVKHIRLFDLKVIPPKWQILEKKRCISHIFKHPSTLPVKITHQNILTLSKFEKSVFRIQINRFSNHTSNNNQLTKPQTLANRIFYGKYGAYLRLMRLDKPIGTWLLLWPCLWSIAIGFFTHNKIKVTHNKATPVGNLPDIKLMALFTVGSVVMRGAGCTINDIIDRNIDKKVERTKLRPLASGELDLQRAIIFLGGQLSIGLAVLLSLNWNSIILGACSLFFVTVYPFMKRITFWPQAFLGLTFNWGALLGYCAVMGYSNWYITLPLYIGGISWTLVYDTIYAHQDKVDDIMAGVKSTALMFGDNTKKWLSLFSVLTISNFAISGIFAELSWPFFASLVAASSHLLWQVKAVDIHNKEDCMKIFIANKWFGAIIFVGIVASRFF